MIRYMPTPKPPTGGLSGAEGKMLLRGSAGRIGVTLEMDDGSFDPIANDRRNETGLDHFSSDTSSDPTNY